MQKNDERRQTTHIDMLIQYVHSSGGLGCSIGIASGVDDKSRRRSRCEDERMTGQITRDDDSNMLQ
jgi:hypothetical protein